MANLPVISITFCGVSISTQKKLSVLIKTHDKHVTGTDNKNTKDPNYFGKMAKCVREKHQRWILMFFFPTLSVV